MRKILIVGAGPAMIGEPTGLGAAAAQACRALRRAGFETVAVDSTPSALMTDAGQADRAYIEPLTVDSLTGIIARARPHALLPALGGPTAATLALALAETGTLARLGVELLGATPAMIRQSQDPARFRAVASRLGLGRPSGESLAGWKAVALEVAYDRDAMATVCSIEQVDPAGVHPGDAIAVAPAQTVSEPALRLMGDAAHAIVRSMGGTSGVASVRFALDPRDGRLAALAMSPHLTFSSGLASAVTGLRLGEIAARLAAGERLDALGLDTVEPRAATRCAVRIPRWAFETFPEADRVLTGEPRAVGEAIALGHSVAEALQKAVRALDPSGRLTLGRAVDPPEVARLLETPTPERLFAIADACRAGWSTAEVSALTGLDPLFVEAIGDLVRYEAVIAAHALDDPHVLREAKRRGFADARIAELTGAGEDRVRGRRARHDIVPAFERAGARGAVYATYQGGRGRGVVPAAGRPRVVIVGPGPHRIGHGAEMDHACAQAASALRALGIDAVVIGGHPAAIGDDADRLYLEPPTLEHVLDVVEAERPLGVIVQLGGRPAQALAGPLQQAGVNVLGTAPEALARASARQSLGALLADLGLADVPGATAASPAEALAIAERLGYPVLVRPTGEPAAVRLAGEPVAARACVAHDADELLAAAAGAPPPILVDKFLEDAVAVGVDAVSDGRRVLVAGVMEQIERVGIHPGDAACVLPPYSLGPDQVDLLHRHTADLARGLGVVGLLHVRFALQNDRVHVLAVHPYASRTVPFVAKATGLPLAALATEVMLGRPLRTVVARGRGVVAVREAVFPFSAFPGVDVALGPEMKSTDGVMGVAADVRHAYLASQLAAGARLPRGGQVWISVRPCDRRSIVMLAQRLAALGFTVVAAGDTARLLARHGVGVHALPPGPAEHQQVLTRMRAGEIALAIDIPEDGRARRRSDTARQAALRHAIPHYTTLDGAQALIGALEVLLEHAVEAAAPLASAA